MTIYLDMSAAINGKAGLGRYAATLADHLSPLLGERLAFFYNRAGASGTVSYTHLRAHETVLDLVCRLLLEKKKKHHSLIFNNSSLVQLINFNTF